MDLKLLLTTFGMVFLAELGDKTQLATFCFSAECDSRISVFLGSQLCGILDAIVEGTETGASLRANHLRIIDTVTESTTKLVA